MTAPELGGSELGSQQHFSDKLGLTKMREGEGSCKTFTVQAIVVHEELSPAEQLAPCTWN